jgi:hypothetical protein
LDALHPFVLRIREKVSRTPVLLDPFRLRSMCPATVNVVQREADGDFQLDKSELLLAKGNIERGAVSRGLRSFNTFAKECDPRSGALGH